MAYLYEPGDQNDAYRSYRRHEARQSSLRVPGNAQRGKSFDAFRQRPQSSTGPQDRNRSRSRARYLSPGSPTFGRWRSESVTRSEAFYDRPHSPSSFEEYPLHTHELDLIRKRLKICLDHLTEACTTARDKWEKTKNSALRSDKFDPWRRDTLTFRSIARMLDDCIFRLRAWAVGCELVDAQSLRPEAGETMVVVRENLKELEECALNLRSACNEASAKDLIPVAQPDTDSEPDEAYFARSPSPIRELPGDTIHDLCSAVLTLVKNLAFQTQDIKRALEPRPQTATAEDIISEAVEFFGTEKALRRYRIDQRLFGAEALRAARVAHLNHIVRDLDERIQHEEAHAREAEGTDREQRLEQEILYLREELRRKGDLRNTGAQYRHRPIYPTVPRESVDVESLMFHGLSWERDSQDPDYYIILQELSPSELEDLFAHSRRLRASRSEHVQQASQRSSVASRVFYVREKSSGRDRPSRRDGKSASRERPRVAPTLRLE